MKLKDVPTTYICQLNKPENKSVLKDFRDRKDYGCEELVNYYKFIVMTLAVTPAWGVSGVNKMVNDLTNSLRAVKAHARKGKTSAPAHANKLLGIIKEFGNKEAVARYCGNYKLQPLLTEEELAEIAAM